MRSRHDEEASEGANGSTLDPTGGPHLCHHRRQCDALSKGSPQERGAVLQSLTATKLCSYHSNFLLHRASRHQRIEIRVGAQTREHQLLVCVPRSPLNPFLTPRPPLSRSLHFPVPDGPSSLHYLLARRLHSLRSLHLRSPQPPTPPDPPPPLQDITLSPCLLSGPHRTAQGRIAASRPFPEASCRCTGSLGQFVRRFSLTHHQGGTDAEQLGGP